MILSLVVAASENNCIGKEGELPWNLPADLKHFKEVTMGKPVIMGRKTHESIGRPLPGRRNIVITRQDGATFEGCETVHTFDEALALVSDEDEVCVIGGGEIYKLALPQANVVYLTRVHTVVDGDTFFPELLEDNWEVSCDEPIGPDAENEYAFTVCEYRRTGDHAL